MSTKRDSIYDEPISTVEDFKFDTQVAEVFDDMVTRSVPLYKDVQRATAALASRLAQPNTTVYDLGCSTGTSLVELCQVINDESIKFVGVDNSEAMLEQCKEKLTRLGLSRRVNLYCEDIANFAPKNASVVVLNYTLQFLAPESREAVVCEIHKHLLPGGALLLSEKVHHKDSRLQSALTELYYDFKRENGYSELEISQKREALENVLITYTAEENAELLKRCGFKNVEQYLKWYTFVSLVALKD